MIKLAYYLGSDYCTGQPGIGPKKAMQMLDKEIEDDEFKKLEKLYLNPSVHKFDRITWKNINYRKAKHYIYNASISSEKKNELLHYIEKLKGM